MVSRKHLKQMAGLLVFLFSSVLMFCFYWYFISWGCEALFHCVCGLLALRYFYLWSVVGNRVLFSRWEEMRVGPCWADGCSGVLAGCRPSDGRGPGGRWQDRDGREVWVDLGEAQSVTPDCISFTEGMVAGLVQTCVFTNWGWSLLDGFHSYTSF